jgi:hypothetical protein
VRSGRRLRPHGQQRRCDDDNACTNDSCDPETGCVNTPNGDPSCSLPCRITGGGIVYEDTGSGEPDPITDPKKQRKIKDEQKKKE